MAKYRKKPVDIEAVQWVGNEREMFDFLTNYQKTNTYPTLEEKTFRVDLCNGGCQLGNLMIKSSRGEELANVGDYIIKDTNGEFYPCKPDIFDMTYEKVE